MRRVLLLLTALALTLFGGARYISPLALPKLKVLSLDIYPCDNACLREYWENGEYFSFLAHLTPKNAPEFKNEYATLAAKLPLPQLFAPPKVTIVLIAKKYLRPIVTKSTKTLLAYLIERNIDFTLKTRYVDPQSDYDTAIEQGAINIVFATFQDKDRLASLQPLATVYIPTINKRFIPQASSSIYFGGIDYFAQLRTLHDFYSGKTALFYLEDSPLSQLLTGYYQEIEPQSRLFGLKKSDKNVAKYLRKNYALNHIATLFNTPLIKTAMIASQMNYYNLAPKAKLSTQINLSPKLFALLQPKAREGFVFANAVVHLPLEVAANASLMEIQSDFDWLGYALFVGVDNILASRGMQKSVAENFIDNQIRYDTQLLRMHRYGLRPLESQESF